MSENEIKRRSKDLEREQDALLEKLKDLRGMFERGEISEEEYEEKRHPIERALVEILDRQAQMRFLLGEGPS
jgi:uncharacterized membrane protein